ncbi:hypothetical protein T265_08416 [Opisthorchis viverrini]|uniref:Reverse transcriptase/retrotransposon-derived protein RNase H-like domain-containing protein n=1 Tax=Opisthorchis viverrini TaxID=6198 RepID=A0A074Z9H7_OPIVI|nr:hypothetical protein T265_08416 [Opisthorchis viverrini]KER23763.1 hypothetical protein T265_08416 [Opisthorchis viverrini]
MHAMEAPGDSDSPKAGVHDNFCGWKTETKVISQSPDFNRTAAPLYDFLGRNRKFEWTRGREASERVKARKLDQQLTLKLPRIGGMFIVAEGASDRGIGAVLKHRNGVIEYASRVID